MTGNELQALRACLGLSEALFAQVVGVSVSSIWRWERMASHIVTVDPLQRSILSAVEVVTGRLDAVGRTRLGGELERGITVGGGLYALHLLLGEVYREAAGPAALAPPKAKRAALSKKEGR